VEDKKKKKKKEPSQACGGCEGHFLTGREPTHTQKKEILELSPSTGGKPKLNDRERRYTPTMALTEPQRAQQEKNERPKHILGSLYVRGKVIDGLVGAGGKGGCEAFKI